MHHWGHTHARALPLFRQRQQAVQRLLWAAQNNRIPAAIACRLTTAAASAQRLSTSQHDGGSSGTPGSSTRVRVLRQAFISVTKDEMHEAMSHFGKQSHGSSAATNWAALRKVLASLEIVYRTEYQRAGEELQCSIRAMNSCVIVPPGARVEKGTHGEPDDAVFASPDDARQLEQQFLQRFQALTGPPCLPLHVSRVPAEASVPPPPPLTPQKPLCPPLLSLCTSGSPSPPSNVVRGIPHWKLLLPCTGNGTSRWGADVNLTARCQPHIHRPISHASVCPQTESTPLSPPLPLRGPMGASEMPLQANHSPRQCHGRRPQRGLPLSAVHTAFPRVDRWSPC
mmetsp:Transcript_24801/g.69070  ORF Transcript_24801/g.69070 Transcript_24801/m.69070 type:complete len:340 (-) Transcript_24801:1646-2665(-)